MPPNRPGTVTLMSSGEMTEAMGKVYRAILNRIVFAACSAVKCHFQRNRLQ